MPPAKHHPHRKITSETFYRIENSIENGKPNTIVNASDGKTMETCRFGRKKWNKDDVYDGLFNVSSKKHVIIFFENAQQDHDHVRKHGVALFSNLCRADSADWNALIAHDDDPAEQKKQGRALLWKYFYLHTRDRINKLNIIEMIRQAEANAATVDAHAVDTMDAPTNAGASNNSASNIDVAAPVITTNSNNNNSNGAGLHVAPARAVRHDTNARVLSSRGFNSSTRNAHPGASRRNMSRPSRESSPIVDGSNNSNVAVW